MTCSRKSIRVGIMAYYYPPVGGGGTARSAGFVKWLPDFGVIPHVFSIDLNTYKTDREFAVDTTLESNNARVTRVRDCDRLKAIKDLLVRAKVFPLYWSAAYRWEYEGQRSWAVAAASEILRTHRENPFDLLYASAGPYSQLELVSKAAKKLNIPWVADLRDPWNIASLKRYPSKIHALWESKFEQAILDSASAIIMNTPSSMKLMLDRYGDRFAEKLCWIPNGIDVVDKRGESGGDINDKGIFKIVHAGTLYDAGVRTNGLARYYSSEIHDEARSLMPLARAMRKLIDEEPELQHRIRIIQYGYTPESLKREVKACVSEQQVFEFMGVRPKSEVVQACLDADALLVLQVAFAGGEVPTPHIPGKTFDYLALEKRILAPIPNGDLWELLSQFSRASVMSYKDEVGLAATLSQFGKRLGQRGILVSKNEVNIQKSLNRRNLTQKLADVFQHVVTGAAVRLPSGKDFSDLSRGE